MEDSIYTDYIKPMIANYGLAGLLVLVLVFVFLNPEKAQILKGWIQYTFVFLIQSCKKPSIKNKIEGSCNYAIKQISKEISDIEMPSISINWVKDGEDLRTKLKGGNAIVNLKFSADNSENIVKATTIFVKDTVLTKAKPYLSYSLKSAIDFNIVRKILGSIINDRNQIINTFFFLNGKDLNELKEKNSQIQQIDNVGLFSRILIKEYESFGNQLYGLLPTNEYTDEADVFFNYLLDISTRNYDENTPLQFEGNILKVGILLVAKPETYLTYGLDAYLRRIKRGVSKGIRTFYLLARDDKVQILTEVASKLLDTGDFILQNKPKEFCDSQERNTICYCLNVDSTSSIARVNRLIDEALHNNAKIEGVISKIRIDGLKVDINGIEAFVKKNNLSNSLIDNIRTYFREGTSIELIPVEKGIDGIVECTLIGTASDPHAFIESEFTIGKVIEAEVSDYGEEIVYFNVGSTTISGSALRRNLTYSRFEFLHKIFPKGNKFKCVITEINFEKNQIYLKLQNLIDPWSNNFIRKGEFVEIIVCQKTDRCIIGETNNGIEAVLPNKELAWFSNDIERKSKSIKLNTKVNCKVIYINNETKSVFVSLKETEQNPYVEFFNKNKDIHVSAYLIEKDKNGIYGTINGQYNLFIPASEIGWGNTQNTYRLKNINEIRIIGVNKIRDGIIGSIKYKTEHPLHKFEEHYPVGYHFHSIEIKRLFQWGGIADINIDGKKYEILLFRGDVISGCYINSFEEVFRNVQKIPLDIKEIDIDKNRIIGSMKSVVETNSSMGISYDDSFDALIIGNSQTNKYVVIILDKWIKGILETTSRHAVGSILRVRPALLSEITIFTED